MEPVKAMVTPPNQGDWPKRGKVQVTARMPMGSGTEQVTMHARRDRSGTWFVLNPDKAAVACLDLAEAVEKKAYDESKNLTAYLANIQGRLDKNKAATEVEGADKKALRAERKTLNARRKEIAAELAEAKKVADAAKAEADSVRAEVSRLIEVIF